MLFLLKGVFKADAEARRQTIHETYGEHLSQHRPRVRLGGSVQDDDGRRLAVMLIVEADDRAEVERFVQASPYTRAGLYERTEIDLLDLEVGALN